MLVMFNHLCNAVASTLKKIVSDLRLVRSLVAVKVSGGHLTQGQCLGETSPTSLTWV